MINHISRVWTCNIVSCSNITAVVIRPVNYAELPLVCLFLIYNRRNNIEITSTREAGQAPEVDAPPLEVLKARLGEALSNLVS